MKPLSDNEIIVKILNGNHDLFRLLVERYKKPVATVIISMLGNCSEADDVGQETFIRLYNSLANFRGDASLKTYLIRIAMNLSLNEIKRRKRYLSTTVSMDSVINISNGLVLPLADRAEIMELINYSIEKLDPRQKAVFILRVMEGYSTKETAKMLQIPIGTVLSRLTRALEEMRKIVPR